MHKDIITAEIIYRAVNIPYHTVKQFILTNYYYLKTYELNLKLRT